jgi:hypothetical protein
MTQFNYNNNTRFVVVSLSPTAIGTDQTIFTAPADCTVISVSETHGTAGSDPGAVSLQLTKETSTDAPGAGTDMLSNNTNVGFDLKGTANTPQFGIFKTTAGLRELARGDRLGIDFAGTTTALALVNVTVLIGIKPD